MSRYAFRVREEKLLYDAIEEVPHFGAAYIAFTMRGHAKTKEETSYAFCFKNSVGYKCLRQDCMVVFRIHKDVIVRGCPRCNSSFVITLTEDELNARTLNIPPTVKPPSRS